MFNCYWARINSTVEQSIRTSDAPFAVLGSGGWSMWSVWRTSPSNGDQQIKKLMTIFEKTVCKEY
jgi:hypothetical protein